MPRIAFLLAFTGVLVTGCNGPDPTQPPPGVHRGTSVQVRNDSTPPAAPSDVSTEDTSGGILIGSGT